MKNLSIRILARTGNTVGLGHWVRSLQLAVELKRRGNEVFLKPIADNNPPSLMPKSVGRPLNKEVDLEIIDDPISPHALCEKAKKRAALDFYGDPNGTFDLVINSIDRTPDGIRNRSGCLRKSGLEYLAFEPGAADAVPKVTDLNILIVLGGRDTKRSTLPILKALSAKLPEMNQLKVILPEDHVDFKECCLFLRPIKNTQVLVTQPSLLPFLAWSKLVICNGGLTAALVLLQKRCGFFIPQTKAESEFLEILGIKKEFQGSIEDLKDYSLIQNKFELAVSSDFEKQISKPLTIDGGGTQRVADAIEEIVK